MNLPQGTRITQTWPAVDGWRVFYAYNSTFGEYPVIAWALLETNVGQRVAGLYVKPHAIAVELNEPQWLGYLPPGERLTEAVIKGLLLRAKQRVAEAEQAETPDNLPPPAALALPRSTLSRSVVVERLSQEEWDIWEYGFLTGLNALALSSRVYNRLSNTVSRARSSDSWAAQFIEIEEESQVVRLRTFREWCRLAAQPDFKERFRKIDNMGRISYDELAQKCRVYLQSATAHEGEAA